MINGNVSGVRRALLGEMEALYEMRVYGEFVSDEIIEALAKFTDATKREISVYITRDGRVADVSLGESASVSMPEMRMVRSMEHLAGVHCIHTHPGGDSRLSDVDIGTLKYLRLDCMAALGVRNGRATSLSAAFLSGYENGALLIRDAGPYRALRALPCAFGCHAAPMY